ncbi:uncharacterized protein NPIL_238221 [Nephila pilipes]|uniref:Uncharacterized protein n=1 Tax=Nephila pilipes TaxID=299642 RepID=A0A8X6PYT3_NEPPI|nr:uncharacterized protein NPIL_238221 [Nephila pilipes]
MESRQPEEALVAWERRSHGLTENRESRNLEHLMRFLHQEVKVEEMINLARTGFGSHQNPLRKAFQNEQLKQSGESSTASALVSLQNPANKLWELKVLGISSENEKEKNDFNLKDFNDNIKFLPDGRYEVELQWKLDSSNLPSNTC